MGLETCETMSLTPGSTEGSFHLYAICGHTTRTLSWWKRGDQGFGWKEAIINLHHLHGVCKIQFAGESKFGSVLPSISYGDSSFQINIKQNRLAIVAVFFIRLRYSFYSFFLLYCTNLGSPSYNDLNYELD